VKKDSILELPVKRINEWPGYVLVLSPHKSERKLPCLTVHIPGNWGKAEFGGKDRTLNIAYASKMLQILKGLKKYGKELEERGWRISYEGDHHGPTVEKPIIFVEIGSGEREWQSAEAGEVVGKAVGEAVKRDEKKEGSYLGVGGGHYAPKFTKLALEETPAGQGERHQARPAMSTPVSIRLTIRSARAWPPSVASEALITKLSGMAGPRSIACAPAPG